MVTRRRICGAACVLVGGALIGLYLAYQPFEPSIRIRNVRVQAFTKEPGTKLIITTDYANKGCERIMLSRFIMNTDPASARILPAQQGSTLLPNDKTQIVERVPLNHDLGKGEWHLFTVATCYIAKEPVPVATVSPTALFVVPNPSK